MRVKILLAIFFTFWSQRTWANCTLEFRLEGAINASSLDFLERAQSFAEKEHCSSILMTMNTPGGNLQTTRKLIEKILGSSIPYLCLISPEGAHAGSAGAIILQACHVTGGVSATNIGAATPIMTTGQNIPEDLRKKIFNDTLSFLEGLTQLRKRNLEFSKEIVTKAKALPIQEAVKKGAVDLLVNSKAEFLEKAIGREVQISKNRQVKVEVGSLKEFQLDLRGRVLSLLADPEVVYILFMGSIALLYFEITHTGLILPGIAGGIGFILSLVSMEKLDVTWGGLLLLFLGLVLMLVEAFTPSFGVIGMGGIVSFLFGSLFLFDVHKTGYSLPLDLILVTTGLLGALTLFLAFLAIRTRSLKKRGEFNELLKSTARVVKLSPGKKTGLIILRGETWKFESQEELELDEEVIVESHQGLILKVIREKY